MVLWAHHAKVKRWIPLLSTTTKRGLDEMIRRQDNVRRRGEPCRFRLLPPGIHPDER